MDQSGLIGAHRGYRARYPENTIAAFEASLGYCNFIEFDVQLTSDSIPVVIHDTTLTRTSNILASSIYHKKGSIRLLDYSRGELQTLDVESWFYEQDPFDTLGTQESGKLKNKQVPQPLLTLDELLSWAKKHHILLNLEIKEPDSSLHSAIIVEKVMEQLHIHQYRDQVLVSSFCHDYLVKCKKVDPTVLTAALVKKAPYLKYSDLISYLKDMEVAAYHPKTDHLDLSLISHLRSSGFMVNVFTVNCQERQKELFEAEASAIITDFL